MKNTYLEVCVGLMGCASGRTGLVGGFVYAGGLAGTGEDPGDGGEVTWGGV